MRLIRDWAAADGASQHRRFARTLGLLNFLNSRVAFGQTRSDREKFDSVVVERLKLCSVLVAIGDGITNGLLSKSLAAGGTTKLPTLLPTI